MAPARTFARTRAAPTRRSGSSYVQPRSCKRNGSASGTRQGCLIRLLRRSQVAPWARFAAIGREIGVVPVGTARNAVCGFLFLILELRTLSYAEIRGWVGCPRDPAGKIVGALCRRRDRILAISPRSGIVDTPPDTMDPLLCAYRPKLFEPLADGRI